MKTSDAVAAFGSQAALAAALGINRAAVCQWGERVPPLRQMQLQALTNGRLRAEPEVIDPALRHATHG